MADWVHCNLCCRQLSGEVKFYLGTCSHIFCDLCKQKGTDPVCALCNNPCRVKELNEDLDQHLKAYFMVPESQIKKQVEVMKFQAQHRSILLRQMRRKVEGHSRVMKQAEEHFHKLKQESGDLRKKLQNLEEVNRQLRQNNSLLKNYIRSYKAYESDSLSQKPVTPLQLIHSPSVVSPLVHYCNGRSPLAFGSRPAVSPTTPMVLSHRGSGAPGCLEEIQNTPRMSRISARQPPSKGRIGTPTQLSLKTSYPYHITSPVVGVDGSPSDRSRVRSNSVNNSPFQLRSPQLACNARTPMPTETPQQYVLKYGSSNQSSLRRNFQSLHEVYKTPFNNASDSIMSVNAANVSSKYFARVIPTPPCTPTNKPRPSPR